MVLVSVSLSVTAQAQKYISLGASLWPDCKITGCGEDRGSSLGFGFLKKTWSWGLEYEVSGAEQSNVEPEIIRDPFIWFHSIVVKGAWTKTTKKNILLGLSTGLGLGYLWESWDYTNGTLAPHKRKRNGYVFKWGINTGYKFTDQFSLLLSLNRQAWFEISDAGLGLRQGYSLSVSPVLMW